MLDFASDIHGELLTWLEGGVDDEDDQIAAIERLDCLADSVSADSHAQMLADVDRNELVAYAHVCAGQLRIERTLYSRLLELLADPGFRRVLDELMADDRLGGSDPAEVVQWARIRHEGAPGAFDRLMGMRETGRK